MSHDCEILKSVTTDAIIDEAELLLMDNIMFRAAGIWVARCSGPVLGLKKAHYCSQ